MEKNITFEQKHFFEQNKYLKIENFFNSEIMNIAHNYYEHKFSILPSEVSHVKTSVECVNHDDAVTPLSRFLYADLFTEMLLLEILPIFRKLSRKFLVPSFSSVRCYERGQSLLKHTDRIECQYSATICMATNIPKDQAWHIQLGDTSIATPLNTIIFYKGLELPHYRNKLNNYGWIAMAHLHFVDANDEKFSKYKLDRRPSLGYPLCNWSRTDDENVKPC